MGGMVLGKSVPRLLQRPLEEEKATALRVDDIERVFSLLLLLFSRAMLIAAERAEAIEPS